jgi:hypothetical protein
MTENILQRYLPEAKTIPITFGTLVLLSQNFANALSNTRKHGPHVVTL